MMLYRHLFWPFPVVSIVIVLPYYVTICLLTVERHQRRYPSVLRVLSHDVGLKVLTIHHVGDVDGKFAPFVLDV
jgi:hypothetical protein